MQPTRRSPIFNADMRSALVLMLLAGCDLVFELREPDKGPSPFLEGYTARKQIDIKLGSTATLEDLPFNLHFVADPDLVNIAFDVFEFTDADGTTVLDYEIERYDAATGDLLVWVRIPQFNSNRIYLYYEGPAVVGRDPKLTWPGSHFSGVWHFATNTPGLRDSTGTNEAFTSGDMIPDEGEGPIGVCRDFDMQEDLTIEPAALDLDFGDTSFSFSIWVNATHSTPPDGTPLSRGSTADGGWGIVLGQNQWVAGVSSGTSNGGKEVQAEFSSNPPFDVWTHLVAVVDRQVGELRTYMNGMPAGKVSVDTLEAINAMPNDIDLARANSSEAYDGLLDEIRIYPYAISDAQISVEYANIMQRELVTIGPAELAP